MRVQMTLEFEDQAEAEEYMESIKLGKAACRILSDMREWLRTDTKHGEGKYTEVYNKLFQLAGDNEVSAWDL